MTDSITVESLSRHLRMYTGHEADPNHLAIVHSQGLGRFVAIVDTTDDYDEAYRIARAYAPGVGAKVLTGSSYRPTVVGADVARMVIADPRNQPIVTPARSVEVAATAQINGSARISMISIIDGAYRRTIEVRVADSRLCADRVVMSMSYDTDADLVSARAWAAAYFTPGTDSSACRCEAGWDPMCDVPGCWGIPPVAVTYTNPQGQTVTAVPGQPGTVTTGPDQHWSSDSGLPDPITQKPALFPVFPGAYDDEEI